MSRNRRETVLVTLDDTVSKFLYYDRKEDEDLPVGAIEEAVRNGEISVDEMVAAFAEHLRSSLAARLVAD